MTLPVSVDPGTACQNAQAAYLELKRQSHTEPFAMTVKWLDALITAQQAHMTSCHPDKLPACQTRIKQLIALRNALAAPGGASTGHCFD